MEAYEENYPQLQAIEKAVNKLTATCMAGYGFTSLPPAASGHPPASIDDSNMPRRYGLSDAAQAARFGYHLANDNGPIPLQYPLSDAESAVANGFIRHGSTQLPVPSTYKGKAIPPGGCGGEAARKVGVTFDTTVAGRLDQESLDRSEADPRVQAVIHRWSACMKGHGYSVDSPLDAGNLVTSGDLPAANTAEITLAKSDVACKTATGLVSTWFTVESGIQRQEIEQNQLALDQNRQLIAQAVKNASALVEQ
ncbi:hypothetical protein ACEZDB_12290 [Streptacidiphilus sp. N1-3]|uniref:PknH-like extracellular domain-containing protein n=1 Tax=Streptacidiphilus alkalitolerans TaxID=3342712 RepID=A0ABV6X0B2_9ACTN